MKKQSGVYVATIAVSDDFYIGSTDDVNRRKSEHLQDLARGRHSNAKLQEAYNQNPNVSFELIPANNRKDAFLAEKEMVAKNANNPRMLNLELNVGIKPDDYGQKISAALKGHPVSQATRDKIGEIHRGNKYWVGKTHSDESKVKMSVAHTGNQYAKGHVVSDEVREKLRQLSTGRQHSEETKRKVSENSAKALKVKINETVYPSARLAGEALGTVGNTILRRCRKGEPGYSFLDE